MYHLYLCEGYVRVNYNDLSTFSYRSNELYAMVRNKSLQFYPLPEIILMEETKIASVDKLEVFLEKYPEYGI